MKSFREFCEETEKHEYSVYGIHGAKHYPITVLSSTPPEDETMKEFHKKMERKFPVGTDVTITHVKSGKVFRK